MICPPETPVDMLGKINPKVSNDRNVLKMHMLVIICKYYISTILY